MEISELKKILQDNGIVGAGGAGFPTYGKLDERADTILLNCAECEPLLKLHRQLLKEHAYEIMKAFHMVAETVHASQAIIGIKEEYASTVDALERYIGEFPEMKIHLLPSAYPMGDEVVLIYEATGKQIRPGGLPIEAGVAVFNVETMYNIHRAVNEQHPVTDKVVSIVGEVANPISVRIPLGTSVKDAVKLAGGATVKDPAYLMGGPMMGFLGSENGTITKTTNAILVLPKDHKLILKKQSKSKIELNRAASICCQCQSCTDLCPRHLLGHPIQPHLFMRAAANGDVRDVNVFLNTFYCSGCGTCELYSCPQGLKPRTLITEYKNGLRANGVKAPVDPEFGGVSEARSYRRVPEARLQSRLGLTKYDKPAPLEDRVAEITHVEERLSQHIGAPAQAVVKAGDMVQAGQLIATPAQGLSVAIHASISGKVTAVDSTCITIQKTGA